MVDVIEDVCDGANKDISLFILYVPVTYTWKVWRNSCRNTVRLFVALSVK